MNDITVDLEQSLDESKEMPKDSELETYS